MSIFTHLHNAPAFVSDCSSSFLTEMFAPIFFAALTAGSALVRADPGPTTPSPGAVYNEGANCDVAWNADTSGVWKTMNIELMTGSNLAMQFLKTVATVDGTDPNKNSYSYSCPEVDPNSAIYFYQFSSPYSDSLYWTGRFAIADKDGNTTPPSQWTVYSGNNNVTWGVGSLVGDSDPGSAPAYGESTAAAPSASSGASGPASTTSASSFSSTPIISSLTVSAVSTASTASTVSTDSTDSIASTASTNSPASIGTTSSAASDSSSISGPPVDTTVIVSGPAATTTPVTIVTVTRSSAIGTGASSPVNPTADSNGADGSSDGSSPTAAANASGAAALKVDTHVFRAVVALGAAALTFVVAF